MGRWRCRILKDDGKIRICSRNKNDWTKRLPHIVRALEELPANAIILVESC